MHSRDAKKPKQEVLDECVRILREADNAAEQIADFSGFVFPDLNFSNLLSQANPKQPEPGGIGFFHKTECEVSCVFFHALFLHNPCFGSVRFLKWCAFDGCTFQDGATFNGVEFWANCSFSNAVFKGPTDFTVVNFGYGDEPQAMNPGGIFQARANFAGAIFEDDCRFDKSTFAWRTDFSGAVFQKAASFRFAEFPGDARPGLMPSPPPLGAPTGTPMQWKEIPKAPQASGNPNWPGVSFCRARFEKPETAVFQSVYLGRVVLAGCDVSDVVFLNVAWRLRRVANRRKSFEEDLDPRQVAQPASPLEDLLPPAGDPNQRNYPFIAELYQQLKSNFDSRCDFAAAGDFHYGEMEMKRLWSPHRNRFLRLWHRQFGLLALYKYASEYGESYVRPGWVLCLLIVAFALLYPFAGLDMPRGDGQTRVTTLSYFVPSASAAGDSHGMWLARFRLLGHSLLTSLYIAAFQKDLEYPPSYPVGRVLALLEVLFTSTFVALFLLAIRRQFKR
jgi:uncharacterized protein YjbI with pentapeptide repeats